MFCRSRAEAKINITHLLTRDNKIILGDLNANIRLEEKRYIDRRLEWAVFMKHQINNMVISSTYFPHKHIHRSSWISPDGLTANQIDQVLIDGRHCSNILDLRSYRGPNIDFDHYLAKIVFPARIRTKVKTKKWWGGLTLMSSMTWILGFFIW